MSDFSLNDVNEAKRRVREMQNRAREFTSEQPPPAPQHTDEKAGQSQGLGVDFGDLFGNLFSNNDSSLILAIILILSREKADNMLILALLYILL